MNELAEFTTTDRTTLTRTMDQLVEMGLVERGATPGDRRLVRVVLTKAGTERFAAAVERLNAHNRRLLDGLSEDDLAQLRSLMQRLLRNIITDDDVFRQALHFQR